MKRKSYNCPNHAHFLTFSCYRHQKLLDPDDAKRILTETWNEVRRKGDFLIWAYVIMPEHVHLLIYPNDHNYQISRILRLLKEPFTHGIVRHWKDLDSPALERILVIRGGRILHRFWQEGGGFDRNLYSWDRINKAIDYIEWNPVRRGLASDPLGWKWSSARSRDGIKNVSLIVDDIHL